MEHTFDLSDEGKYDDLILHIYYEYKGYIRYRVSNKLADQSYLDDVVQDALLKIIRNIKKIKYNDEEHLKAICGRIAEQVAVDFNRKNIHYFGLQSYNDVIALFEQTNDSPDYYLVAKTNYNIIYDTIESFKGNLKDICYLRFIEGLNNATISIMLNLNPHVVSAYICRGKKRIAYKLKDTQY
ncbi:MAG: sigma-70 family RNA polymerase sigma factor [Clostridia bacterium]|nr:sigma-70 family RNA polymerase sigma factor [Clostridia bacterium]